MELLQTSFTANAMLILPEKKIINKKKKKMVPMTNYSFDIKYFFGFRHFESYIFSIFYMGY